MIKNLRHTGIVVNDLDKCISFYLNLGFYEVSREIENGNYMPPLDYGYSIEMKEKSVNEFCFPNGEYWKNNK